MTTPLLAEDGQARTCSRIALDRVERELGERHARSTTMKAADSSAVTLHAAVSPTFA